MPINPHSPFKGRQFPGEVIVLCVRWYLRYPLSYEHVAELVAERGVEVDASCIWRWVQAYAPELNKRCRPHLKPTNRSYRTDEIYIKVKGKDHYLREWMIISRSLFPWSVCNGFCGACTVHVISLLRGGSSRKPTTRHGVPVRAAAGSLP